MKKAYLSLILGLAAVPVLNAQDFVVTTPQNEEIISEVRITPRPTIDGIVKDIFEMRKPWQAVNPAAPTKYGTGEQYVSKDFGPGTPFHSTGLVLASVKW